VGKTTVVYVTFLRDVACQKLLNSANVSLSYSQNNTGTVFLRHGVVTVTRKQPECVMANNNITQRVVKVAGCGRVTLDEAP